MASFTYTAYGWDNCPFGKINESFPGTCGRYRDTDNDGICDLSQPSPEERIVQAETSDTQYNGSTDLSKITSNTARINYYFIPIFIILFLFYLFTLGLGRKKIIKINQHRKIWNTILLITFLISGLFGIILALSISFGTYLSFSSFLLFWHVEFGIAMAMVSFFHIGWHWKYYKNLFTKNT
jgi:amino acid transporter